MKKYFIYLITLIIGVIAGAVIFGGGSGVGGDSKHQHGDSADSAKWTCAMHSQIQKLKPFKAW